MPKFQLEFRCDQRWEGMRPVAAGKRHCDSCDKTVVDVSRMTETEVAKAYKTSGGELCVQGWFEKRDGVLLLKPMPAKKRLSVLQPATLAAAMALAACNEPPRTTNDQTSDASGMDADTDTDAGAGTDRGADVWSKAARVSNNDTPPARGTRVEVAPVVHETTQPETQSQTASALRTWLADTAAVARDAMETAISSAPPRRFMGIMRSPPQPEMLRGEVEPAADDDLPPPDTDLF